MPDSNILAFLFSTVAAVVATLTGLLGAFATFRLQSMDNEVMLLLRIILERQTSAGSLHNWISQHDYARLEQVYDLTPAAVQTLRHTLDESGLAALNIAYEHDFRNIAQNHERYFQLRSVTQGSFRWSLSFVVLCLLLLTGTGWLAAHGSWLGAVLPAFFVLVVLTFMRFERQVRLML